MGFLVGFGAIALYARDPAELRGRLRRFVRLIQRAAGRGLPPSLEE
ncbi:hypothetical protein WME73_18175 [Sorangium sp. So ce302]